MCKSRLTEMRQPVQGQVHATVMLRLRQGLPWLTVDLPLDADAMVHAPVQTGRPERPMNDKSRDVGIDPYHDQNLFAGSDDMDVRQFHDGMVDSIVLNGHDRGLAAIHRERHVEPVTVPVVENLEKPIRNDSAVMGPPRCQSMREHGLLDIVMVNDEPSCLPSVAVRPPHAHDRGYDGDDGRSPSRPITNSNGSTHKTILKNQAKPCIRQSRRLPPTPEPKGESEMSINIPAETPDESTNPISVEEFERLHPAMLGAIGKAVREELEFPRADDYGSSARMPLRKPNPFNAIFPLIYMATGLVCLILGIRRMERWEILFGLAMLMVASQASNRWLQEKNLYENFLVFRKNDSATEGVEGKRLQPPQAGARFRKATQR